MTDVVDSVSKLAVDSGFSGVIRVDRRGYDPWSAAFGLADRRHGIATAFLRSDALPGRAAVGYLETSAASRTNVFHLPVIGSGDGGIFTTVSDIHRLWNALRENRIVQPDSLQMMWQPRSDVPEEGRRYALGFWLGATGSEVLLEGSDAGVSFRSMYAPDRCTFTVISNVSNGAWAIAGELERLLVAHSSR